MATIEPIKITGLREFNRNLRKINAELPKGLRDAHNEAAQLVVDWAVPKIPKRSGRAARSVRVASTRTESRIRGGGRRVPYYPWLDFGGKVGVNKSVSRPFHSDGRYIYPGLAAERDRIYEVLVRRLVGIVEGAGIGVERE